ncbi:MAG: ATP-binding cassette domain-containing protein [Deltaproteobacteria bacterium]|nr:ATP-binding cassette domain-containing protein [Deltaproteobacteria bacterium]MBW1994940.1 ATP-binding cassette domain-containing protein [Deltaproteobacteria bacterium]
MKTPLIKFRDVTKRFNGQTVLDGVNLSIYEGQVTTIIGKSGSGKSVLLKHIIGLLKQDEGAILFRGKDIGKMRKHEWNEYVSQISYMFQNNALFDSMTVFENIALPLRQTTGLSKEEIERKVMARIEQAELTDAIDKYPSELSGGMQKRVALSRALVTDPKIVLFDEPTTGQDPIRKNAILSMIVEYQRKFGFTAVLISHEIPDVYFISNRILALYDGRIVFQGTPEELEDFEHPFQDEFVKSLEGLQEELTGLYSRRHFKVRYQTDLSKRNPNENYVAVVFTLKDMDDIIEHLGHDAAQEIIRSLGTYISKHFGAVGGFSARQTINEIATVLPFSDLEEAERILADFAEDLKKEGLCDIRASVPSPDVECFEFSILAGMSLGKPQVELESIMEFARFNQKEIARFTCEMRR